MLPYIIIKWTSKRIRELKTINFQLNSRRSTNNGPFYCGTNEHCECDNTTFKISE